MEQNNKVINSVQEERSIGDIRIADDVIRIVASLAAREVHGVLAMAGSFSDDFNSLLGKKDDPTRGVSLRFEGKLVDVGVYIIVEFGRYVTEIALAVQEKVKESIENMTGYEVRFVDVHIEGVEKRPKSGLEMALVSELAMEEITQEQKRRAEQNSVADSFEAQLADLRSDTKEN